MKGSVPSHESLPAHSRSEAYPFDAGYAWSLLDDDFSARPWTMGMASRLAELQPMNGSYQATPVCWQTGRKRRRFHDPACPQTSSGRTSGRSREMVSKSPEIARYLIDRHPGIRCRSDNGHDLEALCELEGMPSP